MAATAASVVVLTAARCLQGAAAAASVPSALRLLTTLTAAGPQRRPGDCGLERGRRSRRRQRLRCRRDRHRFGELARRVLGLPAVGRRAGGGHRLGGAARPRPGCFDLVEPRWRGPVHRRDHGASWSLRRWSPIRQRRGSAGCCCWAPVVIVAALLCGWIGARPAPLLPRAVLGLPRLRQGTLGCVPEHADHQLGAHLGTLYLQDTLGRSPLTAAAMLLPFSLAVIGGSALAAAALRRSRPQRVVGAGLALIGSADLVLIWAAWRPLGAAGLRSGSRCRHRTVLGRRDWPGYRRRHRLARHRLGHHQHRRPARHSWGSPGCCSSPPPPPAHLAPASRSPPWPGPWRPHSPWSGPRHSPSTDADPRQALNRAALTPLQRVDQRCPSSASSPKPPPATAVAPKPIAHRESQGPRYRVGRPRAH